MFLFSMFLFQVGSGRSGSPTLFLHLSLKLSGWPELKATTPLMKEFMDITNPLCLTQLAQKSSTLQWCHATQHSQFILHVNIINCTLLLHSKKQVVHQVLWEPDQFIYSPHISSYTLLPSLGETTCSSKGSWELDEFIYSPLVMHSFIVQIVRRKWELISVGNWQRAGNFYCLNVRDSQTTEDISLVVCLDKSIF